MDGSLSTAHLLASASPEKALTESSAWACCVGGEAVAVGMVHVEGSS